MKSHRYEMLQHTVLLEKVVWVRVQLEVEDLEFFTSIKY
jgi:hypothetical protein